MSPNFFSLIYILTWPTGGKAKPLKAPKKAPKGEMDEEDKAFHEKQRAGNSTFSSITEIYWPLQQMQRLRLKWLQRPRAARVLSTRAPRESRRAARNKGADNGRLTYRRIGTLERHGEYGVGIRRWTPWLGFRLHESLMNIRCAMSTMNMGTHVFCCDSCDRCRD